MMNYLYSHATVLLLLAFMIITFLQSGFDKILDWNGNLSWLKGHFSKTPFKNIVPLLLGIVLVCEMIAGICCTIGIFEILTLGESKIAFYGGVMSCITLVFLLFGQRIAKDYEGARTIVVYFIPAIFLVYLLQA